MPVESLTQQLAFEIFVLKGARATDANAEYIATKVGVNARTIWVWYKKFNWRQRAEVRVKERGDELKETTVHASRQIEDVAAEIIEELVDQFKEKVDQNKIKIERVSDFERLIRTLLMLTGRLPGGETTINVITAIPRPEVKSNRLDPGFWKKAEKPALPGSKEEN